VPKLEKEGVKTTYTDVVNWFEDNFIELNYTDTDEEFYASINAVTPLNEIIKEYAADYSKEDQIFCKELILWALTINNKLDRSENSSAFTIDSAGFGKHFFR
jgi:magnesium chelatase subunit I